MNFYTNVSYFHEWIVTTIAANGGAEFCDHVPLMPTVLTSYNDFDLVFTILNDLQWVFRDVDRQLIETIPAEWIFGVACATEAMVEGTTVGGATAFGEIDRERMVACGKCFDQAYTKADSLDCAKRYTRKTYKHCQKFFDGSATEDETLPCMLKSVKYYAHKKSEALIRDGLENAHCSTMSNLLEDMVLFMKRVMRLESVHPTTGQTPALVGVINFVVVSYDGQ